ncbi:MAG: hypothetical protein RR614_12135 [Eubacterium sp.]
MSKTIFNEHRYTEGYMNPTAGAAIENIEREERRKQKRKVKPETVQRGKEDGDQQQK